MLIRIEKIIYYNCQKFLDTAHKLTIITKINKINIIMVTFFFFLLNINVTLFFH